jgi:hypothetical protein
MAGEEPPEAGELHVLEWSPEQNACGIRPLREALTENQRGFREGKPTSYHPLALYTSCRDASAACDVLMRIRNSREALKQADESECKDDET